MKMEEWKECKLGDICNISSSKRIFAEEYVSSGIPFYRGKEIIEKHNKNTVSSELFITHERFAEIKSKFPVPQIDDILLTSVGTLGIPWLVNESNFYFKDGNLTWFRSNTEKVNPKFLYYWFESNYAKNQIDSMCIGSTQKALTIDTLSKFSINLPPLPTQQKIAAILSSLDDKIELNNKINTNLEQQAQALFKNWFVDKYEKEGTIGDYCAVKSGFAFKSAWWQEEGIKVIRIGDIEQGCLNLETCAHIANDKIEIAKDFIVQGGDLVIAMTGATIGKFSMIPKTQEPILVNQRVGKFFLGNNPIEKVPFIYCTLKQEEVITEFINRGQGSAQSNISTGDILSIPCWIPNKNEIDNFNKTIQPMFETIISNQEENRKLSVLRDSLLPKLMNGEIFI